MISVDAMSFGEELPFISNLFLIVLQENFYDA